MGYDWNTWPRHFRPSVASTTAFWNSTEIEFYREQWKNQRNNQWAYSVHDNKSTTAQAGIK